MTSKDISLSSGFKGGPLTMSSREIASLCEKRHTHVLRDIEKMLLDISQPNFGPSDFEGTYRDATGRSLKEYRLPKDLTVTLITGYRADLRFKVVKRLEELEAQAVRPAIPTNMVEALRLAADAMERAETAERTKAEIGSRREATAMATASREKREADRLRKELGQMTDYAAVKRMEKVYKDRKFNWRDLKKASAELDLPIRELEDSHYGKINAYHAIVWRKVYGIEIQHLGGRA